uniref:Uncharacterized protein n=1 Tax=Candidatus Kentrum sp. TC TaxID=2126339 RepID=A0A450ZSR0_9GAMM|nr:MAG: hypothetical protein BECKTC1821F_GA0114240_101250 [Candidatus Kentron sp. TC]
MQGKSSTKGYKEVARTDIRPRLMRLHLARLRLAGNAALERASLFLGFSVTYPESFKQNVEEIFRIAKYPFLIIPIRAIFKNPTFLVSAMPGWDLSFSGVMEACLLHGRWIKMQSECRHYPDTFANMSNSNNVVYRIDVCFIVGPRQGFAPCPITNTHRAHATIT